MVGCLRGDERDGVFRLRDEAAIYVSDELVEPKHKLRKEKETHKQDSLVPGVRFGEAAAEAEGLRLRDRDRSRSSLLLLLLLLALALPFDLEFAFAFAFARALRFSPLVDVDQGMVLLSSATVARISWEQMERKARESAQTDT